MDSLTYPVTVGRKKKKGIGHSGPPSGLPFPPQMIKRPHPAAQGLQAAQPGQALPGTQQGNAPGRFFFHLQHQFAEKSCRGWAGPHFPPCQPTSQAVAACPVTMEMAAARRPTGLCLSFPLLAALPFRGLETRNTAVRGDLSEENSAVRSQEEAQGRSCY